MHFADVIGCLEDKKQLITDSEIEIHPCTVDFKYKEVQFKAILNTGTEHNFISMNQLDQ